MIDRILSFKNCCQRESIMMFKHFMHFLQKIGKRRSPEQDFIFPYSPEKLKKREQIWGNLKKGILFEDKNILIPWSYPFFRLSEVAEQKRNSGDRTEWDLGTRLILDGYEIRAEVMKWVFVPPYKPIKRISANLGFDDEGMRNFDLSKNYITSLLGEPKKIELEQFGSLHIGEVQWQNGGIQIMLIGIEHFNCRYSLEIGHIRKNAIY